jgi:hypothetical protein
MVFFRTTKHGHENRPSSEAYAAMEDRLGKYMDMGDVEWQETFNKMYYDRRYPGLNNFKLEMIPCFFYVGMASALSYELFLSRNIGGFNFLKLALIPTFSLLSLRNVDRAYDIMSYRFKYPEMYQP